MKTFELVEIAEYNQIIDEQIKLSREYALYREAAARAKQSLDILLAASFASFRKEKSNLGYEAALIMLMEDNEEAMILYKELKENEAKYKGLEKILEALQAKVSFGQSVMKYIRENT